MRFSPLGTIIKNSLHRIRFRSERFFHILGEGWYFEAREGMFGPHETKVMAGEALKKLIARCSRKRPENLGDRAA